LFSPVLACWSSMAPKHTEEVQLMEAKQSTAEPFEAVNNRFVSTAFSSGT
jgi:hypothetical protein